MNSVHALSETQEFPVFCCFSSCKNRIYIYMSPYPIAFIEMDLIMPDVYLVDKQQGNFRARVAPTEVLVSFYHFYLT